MDDVIPALAKKKTQWNEDLFFGVMCAPQKLSIYYTESNCNDWYVTHFATFPFSFPEFAMI
jgi:hypothetical protein